MTDNPQLVANVLGRPVTLLAGFPCRAQVVQRRRYGPRIQVECHRHELPGTIEFRLDEPVSAGADMAIRTGHALVRRAGMRGMFRLHHGVARHAAKLDRLHDVHALVGRAGNDDDVDDRGAKKDQEPAARGGNIEIAYRQQRDILAPGRLAQLAPP